MDAKGKENEYPVSSLREVINVRGGIREERTKGTAAEDKGRGMGKEDTGKEQYKRGRRKC